MPIDPKDTENQNLNAALPGDGLPDEVGRRAAEARLEPRVSPVVGNLADLQRMGADAIADGVDSDSAFQFPPNATEESVGHPADIDASVGLITAETERKGTSPDPVTTETTEPTGDHVIDTPAGSAVVPGAPFNKGDDAAKAEAKVRKDAV